MNIIFDKLLFCFIIIAVIAVIICTLIYDCILPIIKYFSDDCSDIKKELIKIGVNQAEYAQFKRIKIYECVYKSSIPLTINIDKESSGTAQYFEFWDITPYYHIIFGLYPKNKKKFIKIFHKIITDKPFKN